MAELATITCNKLWLISLCFQLCLIITLCQDMDKYDNDLADLANRFEQRIERRKQEEEREERRQVTLDDQDSVQTLRNIAQRLDNMTNLIAALFQKYSRREPPNYPNPVEVKIGVYIKDFYAISEQTMDFSMNYYLRLQWNDPKLAFQPEDNFGRDVLTLETRDITDKLWIPDVFLRNEKDTNSLSMDDITASNTLARVSSSGDIWFVRELTTKFRCNMKLQNYPIDTQECPIQFESFKYTLKSMNLSLMNNTVEFGNDISFESFTLSKLTFKNCSEKYTLGMFPCQEIRFVLQRQLGYFIIQVYMPSMLTVMLSWLTFWVDMDAGNQVALALLLVLTMTTISTSVQQSLPRVSYIKAMDVWAFSCLFFVCASLLEISVVNFIARKEASKKKTENKNQYLNSNCKTNKNSEIDSMLDINQDNQDTSTIKPKSLSKGERIHYCARILFPAAFALFNTIYWSWYLSRFSLD